MYAAGLRPAQMIEMLLKFNRSSFWDLGGIGGLLKGKLFLELIQKNLPEGIQNIEDCPIPFGTTAYDILRFQTRCLASGPLATAILASCTFPGMFQPVLLDGWPHIDGGVWDHCGLMALPLPEVNDLEEKAEKEELNVVQRPAAPTRLIVNVVFGSGSLRYSKLPNTPKYKHCKLLSIVVENIPRVDPFTMETMGPKAYQLSRLAMKRALQGCHMQELSPRHWCCFVDGHRATLTALPGSVREAPPDVEEEEDEVNALLAPASRENDLQQRTQVKEELDAAEGTAALHKIPSFSFLNGHFYVLPSNTSTNNISNMSSSTKLVALAPSCSQRSLELADDITVVQETLEGPQI
mmetsp:Transcript_30075/g.42942  ORF Transcript_30075/g.42942 Transcript_30075/m.42942 type:complete len:351 (+) Transcript_30075:134-1186(+)